MASRSTGEDKAKQQTMIDAYMEGHVRESVLRASLKYTGMQPTEIDEIVRDCNLRLANRDMRTHEDKRLEASRDWVRNYLRR